MPIYDFKCEKCDAIFEKMVLMGQSAECSCGSLAEKLVTGSSFKLSGAGWYKDGYGLNRDTVKE